MKSGSAETRMALIGKTALNEDELYKMKFDAWVEHEVIVLRPEQVQNDLDRQHLVNIANRVYGKRRD